MGPSPALDPAPAALLNEDAQRTADPGATAIQSRATASAAAASAHALIRTGATGNVIILMPKKSAASQIFRDQRQDIVIMPPASVDDPAPPWVSLATVP